MTTLDRKKNTNYVKNTKKCDNLTFKYAPALHRHGLQNVNLRPKEDFVALIRLLLINEKVIEVIIIQ